MLSIVIFALGSRRCGLLAGLLALTIVLALLVAAESFAEPPSAKNSNNNQPPAAAGSQDAFNQLITDLARRSLPEEYEDTKHWGKTKSVFDGLKISRDGLQIKTKRRRKEVNHGAWRRYRVEPLDAAEQFQIEVQNLRGGGEGRLAFDVVCTVKTCASARLSQWNLGVQLVSLSAEADAKVRVRMTMAAGFEFRQRGLWPEVHIKPQALAVDLDLLEFRLRKISKLDGPVVKELGDALHGFVAARIAVKRQKLVDQVNKQIAKHPEKLRLSLADFSNSRWSDLKATVLGDGAKK